MAKRLPKRSSRKLTDSERRRIRKLRAQIEPEKSEILAKALALKKAAAVPQKLQELRTLVSQQPETFQAGWSFDGTAHYVQTEQVFARYRPWLMELFAVVKAKDRAALLAALDRVQAGFTP